MTLDEIRKAYVKRYPHLRYIKSKKAFVRAALMLAAPKGVSPVDIIRMARLANR